MGDNATILSEMIGKTFQCVKATENNVCFWEEGGIGYEMCHHQDCCEVVVVEDICGDLDNLVGMPILVAEERSGDREPLHSLDDSWTWTFYEFATFNGNVTIRWYGTSNGYYSEQVDMRCIKDWGGWATQREV